MPRTPFMIRNKKATTPRRAPIKRHASCKPQRRHIAAAKLQNTRRPISVCASSKNLHRSDVCWRDTSECVPFAKAETDRSNNTKRRYADIRYDLVDTAALVPMPTSYDVKRKCAQFERARSSRLRFYTALLGFNRTAESRCILANAVLQ